MEKDREDSSLRVHNGRFQVDQFILSYGGLRGAIAYGLANSIDERLVPSKQLFLTTTIAVIYFTVFLQVSPSVRFLEQSHLAQGSTIRPLANFLNVPRKGKDEPTMAESVYVKVL